MFGIRAVGISRLTSIAEAVVTYTKGLILSLKGDSAYNKNQNTTILDRSQNDLVVTRGGDAAQTVSSFSPFSSGASYYFDGSGDYMTVPSSTAFGFGTGDFTIEFWVYLNSTAGAQTLYSNLTSGSSVNPHIWCESASQGGIIYYYTNSSNAITGQALATGTWYHVALTRSSGSTRLFINGTQTGSTYADSNDYGSTAPLGIGTYWDGGAVSTNPLTANAYVSNVRVVKGTAVYTAAFTPPTTALTTVPGTSLLTCHSGRLFDASTNAANITVAGNTSASTFGPFSQTALSGSVGSTSVYFDGNGDYLSVPTSTAFDFGTGDFTIECWAYRTGAGTGDRFLVSRGNGANFLLRWNAAGALQFYINAALVNSYTYAFPLNSWVHIAVARSGTVSSLFINGEQVSTVTNSATVSSAAAATLIGGFSSSDYFQGYISNVRIVKGTALYTGSFTPSTTALTAVSGTSLLTLQDSSFRDNSSNAFAITKSGDVTSYSISPFASTSNWSGYFDGSGDYLTTPVSTALSFSTGDFTIEGWWNTPALTATAMQPVGMHAASIAGTSDVGFGTYMTSTLCRAFIANGSTQYNIDGWQTSVKANAWQHFALVRQSGVLKFYIDGVQVGTVAANVAVNYNAAWQVRIGNYSDNTSRFFNGSLSNIRIVKGTAVYTANFTPPLTALTAVSGTSLLTLQDSTFKDNSSNAFTVTKTGNTEIRKVGPFGAPNVWSGYFDGTGDYLTVADATALNMGSSDFTMECWFYPTVTPNNTLFSKRANTSIYGATSVNFNNSLTPVVYATVDGSSWGIASTSSVSCVLNTWNHIAWTRSGSTWRLFVNGQVGITATLAGTVPTNAAAFTVGASAADGTGAISSSHISNFRIVKGTAVYTAAFTPSTTPLTAISGTSLLTLQNSTFKDNSSNAFTITRAGDAAVREVGPFNQTTSVSGYFDGNGDYLTVADATALRFMSTDYTVEAWIYPTVAKAELSILSNTTNGSNGWLLRWAGTKLTLTYPGIRENVFGPTGSVPVGAWTHVAIVQSGSTVKGYINGVEYSITSSSPAETNGAWKIGTNGYDANGYFTGYISNLRIVKGTALYTGSFTPSTTPLTAVGGTSLLTLQGSTFTDNSSNAFTVTKFGDVKMLPGAPFIEAGVWSSYFDGTGDYLTLPTGSLNFMHQGTASWTFDTWFYSTSAAIGSSLLSTTSASAQTGIYIGINNVTVGDVVVAFSRSSTGNQYIGRSPTGKIIPNTWNHLAVTFNSTSKAISIFINGEAQPVTITGTATFSAGAATYAPDIGRHFSNGAAGSYFTGYMSNMRVVQGSILYSSNFTPSTSGLTAVSGTSLLTCDGAAISDSSTNNATVTVSGNSKISSLNPFGSGSGWSGYFDGTGDYLSIPSNAAFAFGTGDFTVEMWFNTSNATTRHDPLSVYTSTTGFGFALSFDNAGDVLFYNGDTQLINTSGSQWSANTWNHLAVSRSGTALRMFLNGAQIGSVTNSTNFTIASSLYIGIAGNVTLPYTGYLSNVRIVKGTALYTTAFTPSTSPLTAVSGTSLLTLQDNTFKDNSSNAFTLTRAGDVATRAVGPFGAGNVWSGYFDGTGDYLSVPYNINLLPTSGTDFAAECWVYTTARSSYHNIMCMNNSTQVDWRIYDNNGTWAGRIAGVDINGSSIVLNKWTHLALVQSSNTIKFYVDGVLQGSQAGSAWTNNGIQLTIGAWTEPGRYFTGYISNARVVKGTAVYTANFTPSTSPLTAVSGTSLLTLQDRTFKDNSSNGFAITRSGDARTVAEGPFAATFPAATAVFPGSIYFDGSNDYLTIPASTAMNVLGGDFTVECWFNPTTINASSFNYLIMQDDGGSDSQNFQLKCLSTGIIQFLSWNTSARGSAFAVDSVKTVKLGAWNHIAVTHVKSTNTTRLFLNGVLEASSTTAVWAGSTQPTCIGNWNNGLGIQNSTYSKLNGYLSGVRLIKGTAVYTAAFTPPTAPPTVTADTALLLNFNDGAVVDTYGSSSAGVISTFGDASTNTVTKKYGTGSVYFDGTGDYLSVSSNSDFAFGSGDFTIEFWANFASLGSGRITLTKGYPAVSAAPFLFYNDASNNLLLFVSSDGTNWIVPAGTTIISAASTNTWYHVAVTRSGNTFRTFVNGTQISTFTSSASLVSNTQALTVGSGSGGNNTMNGYIDNLRIYKGYAKYTASFTPSAD